MCFFWNKKRGVILINRSYLEIFTEKLNVPVRIDFHPNTIKNLEDVDKEWLTLEFIKIKKEHNIKIDECVVILTNDVVFSKEIPADTKEEKEESFLEDIPFDPANVLKKEFRKETNILVVAVNKSMCQSLKEIIEAEKIKVTAMIPEAIFSNIQLNKDFIKMLYKQKNLLATGSF